MDSILSQWALKSREFSLAGDQRDAAEAKESQSMRETQPTIAGESCYLERWEEMGTACRIKDWPPADSQQ